MRDNLEPFRRRSVPVEYQGQIWSSYTALGVRYGLRPEVVKQRLLKNQPLEMQSLPRRYYDMRKPLGRI